MKYSTHFTVAIALTCAGLLYCIEGMSQELRLGMTKNDFVNIFGKPDYDNGSMVVYDENFFIFHDDILESMDIISRRFTLNIHGTDGITVGDSFPLIRQNSHCRFELLFSSAGQDFYSCITDIDKLSIRISVSNDVIQSFMVATQFTDKPFKEREFKYFFENSYNPVKEIPDNSLWPAEINVDWKKAGYSLSKDKSLAVCCAPFTSKSDVVAFYSGKECPPVARRLVIAKALDSSNMFRQSFVSIVPKAGLSPGDEFSGIIFYNNVNSGTCFAWECYESGNLVYSKYPSQKSGSRWSGMNSGIRQLRKLSYNGGQEAISDSDWMLIAANRMDTTLAYPKLFTPGRSEKLITAEKSRYSFHSAVNPDFSRIIGQEPEREPEPEPEPEPESEKQSEIKQDSETAVSGSGKEPAPEEELPVHFGKLDNLSGILRPERYVLNMAYERRENPSTQEVKNVLVCTNTDHCDYTIQFRNGADIRVTPGKTQIKEYPDQWTLGYYLLKGDAVSNINVKFPYALPVAPGTRIRFVNDPREKFRSFAVLMKVGESVHAMRGGRVCRVQDSRSVLVYHKDGTFAAYMNVDDICVSPGDYVNPGDAIGACGGGKLSISIFYLDSNKIKGKQGSMHTHITPYVRTGNGDVKLEPGIEYTSLLDTDIITKEMTSFDKKKYLRKLSK